MALVSCMRDRANHMLQYGLIMLLLTFLPALRMAAEELDALPAPQSTALASSGVDGNAPAFSDCEYHLLRAWPALVVRQGHLRCGCAQYGS